ncbi:glycosyltransferase [bacterium]|nr:glycosyltransferase [bacterium]
MRRSPIILVSRDRRTASQFRGAWTRAAFMLRNVDPIEVTRFEIPIVLYLVRLLYYKLNNKSIMVFGVSEMLLLGWLKPNVGVVTGLGRLLAKSSKNRKVFFWLLRLLYKNQVLFVLNMSDYNIFTNLGFNNVYRINGEGFKRRIFNSSSLDFRDVKLNVEKVRFLFVGRFLKSKGVEKLIEIFLQLSSLYPDSLEMYVVGDTDYSNSDNIEKKYISRKFLNENSNIRFFAYTNSLSKFVNSSTIYVSLSEREGMPFSVLEMLDVGIPCILSNVPGHSDLREIENVMLLKSLDELSTLNIAKLRSLPRLRDNKIDKYTHETLVLDMVSILKKRGL